MALNCVDCGRLLTEAEAKLNVTRCDACAGVIREPESSGGAPLHDEASLETEDEQLTQAQRDELFGTAFVSPWWITSAPGPIRLLLTLATLPGIVLGLLMFLLTPFGWLVNVLTGHRFNSTWGLRIIQMFRTAILLIGPTWLLSLLWLPLAGVYLGWMLVYLVLRQFNGAADQERRMYAAMDMEDEMLERLKRE